jgi:hypothetical protein
MALEFDKKTRSVKVRVGGPGLFEAMQDPASLSAEDVGDDTSAVPAFHRQRSKNRASVSPCAPFSPDHAGPRPRGPSGAERGSPARVSAPATERGRGRSAPAPGR